MGCWVVPTVAAEIWGVPLNYVLDCIKSGRLLSKMDSGFVLVDAHPGGMQLRPPALPKERRPPTYTLVTKAELEALTADDLPNVPEFTPEAPAISEEDEPFDWQQARQRISRTRRPAMAH